MYIGGSYVGEVEAYADGETLVSIDLSGLKNSHFSKNKIKKEFRDKLFQKLSKSDISSYKFDYEMETMTIKLDLPSKFYKGTKSNLKEGEQRPWEVEALRPSIFSGQFRVNLDHNMGLTKERKSTTGINLDGGLQLWRIWLDSEVTKKSSRDKWMIDEPRGYLDFPEHNLYFNFLNISSLNYGNQSHSGSGIRIGNRGSGLKDIDIRNEYSRKIILKKRSKVDIIVNSKNVSSLHLDKGVHTLEGLPFYNEFNDVKIVITDEDKKKRIIEYQVMGSSDLISPGKFYWDISATGKRSDQSEFYSELPNIDEYFVAAAYGVTKNLTLESSVFFSELGNYEVGQNYIYASRFGNLKLNSNYRKRGEDFGSSYQSNIPLSLFGHNFTLQTQYQDKEYSSSDFDNLSMSFNISKRWGPFALSYGYRASKDFGGWFNDSINTDLSLNLSDFKVGGEYDLEFDKFDRNYRYRLYSSYHYNGLSLNYSYNDQKAQSFSINYDFNFSHDKNSLSVTSNNDENGSSLNSVLSHNNDLFYLSKGYSVRIPRMDSESLNQSVSLKASTSLFFVPGAMAIVNREVDKPFALTSKKGVTSNKGDLDSLNTSYIGGLKSYDISRLNLTSLNDTIKNSQQTIYNYRNSGHYLDIETIESKIIKLTIYENGKPVIGREFYLANRELNEYKYQKTDANAQIEAVVTSGQWSIENYAGDMGMDIIDGTTEIDISNFKSLVTEEFQ
jgi:hypothetical protein